MALACPQLVEALAQCPTHRRDMVCIWPNSTRANESGSNAMVALLQRANANMTSR